MTQVALLKIVYKWLGLKIKIYGKFLVYSRNFTFLCTFKKHLFCFFPFSPQCTVEITGGPLFTWWSRRVNSPDTADQCSDILPGQINLCHDYILFTTITFWSTHKLQKNIKKEKSECQ